MSERTVPFLALGGLVEEDDLDAATRVIAAATAPGGNFFPLPEETDFQNAFAAHEGAARAVAVNSCGTALDLCMNALGVGPGDEVITTGLTFICTATCAAAKGATVRFADIDRRTLCLDPEAVRRKITAKTKAIIPVHFAGLACDIDGFDSITAEYGIPVIYDAAHAVGTRYRGGPIGARGTASCYSFQSNKNMTTLGEGGAVTTDDPQFAETVRRGKTFGYVYGGPKLRIVDIGFNYRMTKPQAAVGLIQLAKVGRVLSLRRAAFARLHELLDGIEELILPAGIDEEHGSHLYVVRLRLERFTVDRDGFAALLKGRFGIGTAVHYPAVWSWEAATKFEHDRSDTAVTEEAAASVLSLPVFPSSSPSDLEYVADSLRQAIREVRR
jgi:dTDP-4-amino-4,6-dideoxygalactose transaminase